VERARELGVRVSMHVHGRGSAANDELLGVWQREGGGEVTGVLHCYTHDLHFARRAMEQRLAISFSGILTFKKSGALREVAAALPLENLLVETDSPLLSPEGQRGKRNEPARVTMVGAVLAEVQQRPLAEVAAATSQRARELFRLPG